MRGDSLRDFYAKSLALLGLAALAGVGAIVDYWPTDVRAPRVSRLQLAQPLAGSAVAISDAALRQTLTTARPALPVTPVIAVPADAIEPIADEHLWAPQTVADLSLEVAPAAEALGAEIGLAAPPAALPIDSLSEAPDTVGAPLLLAAPSLSASNDSSSISVLTDALRKTGESIVRGGAKTGASIVDAMRVVGGAFKKVPWF